MSHIGLHLNMEWGKYVYFYFLTLYYINALNKLLLNELKLIYGFLIILVKYVLLFVKVKRLPVSVKSLCLKD